MKQDLLDCLRGLVQTVFSFVGRPASARPLAFFRVCIAGVLLAQAFALTGSIWELYGQTGVVQWTVIEKMIPAGVPSVGRIAHALAWLGVSESQVVLGVFLVYVGGLVCLLIGWQTRMAALCAWFTHLAMMMSARATIYGVDSFANIALFYCIFIPVGAAASLDLLAGRISTAPSVSARLGIRLLQIHMCIVYLASGLEKASGIQWWNGEAIWRAVMRPDFARFDFSWLADAPWIALLVCWGTLALEIGYAFLAWPARTRRFWAGSTIAMHVGIAIVLDLVSFSAIMIVLTTSAFLIDAEPTPVPSIALEGEHIPIAPLAAERV